LAPARAIAIAISRPMPPPAPVTAAILPSNMPAIGCSSLHFRRSRSNDEAEASVNWDVNIAAGEHRADFPVIPVEPGIFSIVPEKCRFGHENI
jgi:hypothetical protein